MKPHVIVAIIGTSLLGGVALANDPLTEATSTASYIGHAVGAANACPTVARARIKIIADKLAVAISNFTTVQDQIVALKKSYESGVAEGTTAIRLKKSTCASADTGLAYWERPATAWLPEPLKTVAAVTPAKAAEPAAKAEPTPPAAKSAEQPVAEASAPVPVPVPMPAPVPVAAAKPPPVAAAAAAVHGVSQNEIRFGMSAPLTGPSKEYGRQSKIGTLAAFGAANDAGGLNGRKLVLFTADDGYDPTRTPAAIKQLYEQDKVFGFIGNFGTVAASEALPYVLSRKALYFAPGTGADLVRRTPPDRYVFNYRPSYAEEAAAIVQYLVKVRRLRPEQIAVFTQQDGFGDAGFEAVTKAIRGLKPSGEAATIMRLNYTRNSLDLDGAIAQLQRNQHLRNAIPVKAVVMIAAYRPAAKFIERTHEAVPGLIYASVSDVGATSLAEELTALGPKYANGVIVTRVVPAVGSYASVVLDYKAALEKYFPDEQPDYTSLEAYIQANILIEGLRRAGPDLNTEKLVGALESLHDFDMHLGARVNLSADDHQAMHKVWGTQLDASGHYQPLELE